MPQLTIVTHGESAALVLPTKLLEAMGLRVGDVVDVSVGDHTLILQPMPDPNRRKIVEEATQDVFDRRRDAYQRLA